MPREAKGVWKGTGDGKTNSIGYSYFQDPSLAGYYEQPQWYGNAPWAGKVGFILIGDKRRWPGPSQRQIPKSSLEWAIDLARTPVRPERPEHRSGLAAYDGWATGLEVAADFPAGKPEVLATRVMVHGDQTVTVEERRSAAGYLRSMARVAPEAAEHLHAAAALYDEVAAQSAGVWLWGYSMGPEVGQALADAATRQGIARHVRAAGEIEARAVACLEQALAAL